MITNDTQLTQAIIDDMIGIIDEVAEEIYKELQKQMDDIVYDPYATQVKKYPRHKDNGGLRGMFEVEKAMRSGNTVISEIGENSSTLHYHPEPEDGYVHGSHYQSGGQDVITDIRDVLIEIITEGRAGRLFGEGFWRSPRNFWKPLIDMIENKKFDKYIEQGFKKRGIKFKKG